MSRPTTGPQSYKKYRCKRCGFVAEQQTNHWGETYSWGKVNCCPKCPPYAKYPEFGGSTTWECMEKPPATHDKPKPWKKVKLGDMIECK